MCFMISPSCTKREKPSTDTLRLNFLTEVNSLDPRYGYEIPANHVVKMLYEGLMRNTPEGELVCAACESYQISNNQKTYIFRLRPMKWSNGDPVTAYDFEYTWKSMINPKLPTQGAAAFYPIKNVQAIVRGELPVEAAGILAKDDQTLVVTLEYSASYFLDLTTTSIFSPVNAKIAKKNEKPVWEVTNGPFALKEWKPHVRMILEKNSLYWNANRVKMDQVEISIVEDVVTQLVLFEKGEVDWLGKPLSKISLEAISGLKERNELVTFPERAVYWYFLNTKEFPFTNKKIRKAFAYATNRNALVSHICQENEQIATNVNPGWGFKDNAIQQAQSLFEEALAELNLTRETFPPIKLSYCGIEINHKIATVVQQQWQVALSIKVELDPQEWTAYYDHLVTGKYLVGGLSWHSRIADPIFNLQLFKYGNDRLNISNWENPHFQELVSKAEETGDQTRRSNYLKQAEELLMEEMPVIPLYFLSISYAKNPDLKGVYISGLNEIDFAFAHK